MISTATKLVPFTTNARLNNVDFMPVTAQWLLSQGATIIQSRTGAHYDVLLNTFNLALYTYQGTPIAIMVDDRWIASILLCGCTDCLGFGCQCHEDGWWLDLNDLRIPS